MTHTQQIIHDAIEGGWNLWALGFKDRETKDGDFRIEHPRMIRAWCKVYDLESKYEPWKSGDFRVNVGEVLLDPLFWQAVGKTRGWKYPNSSTVIGGISVHNGEWVDNWHEFIDLLVEGDDYETALSKLN